MGKALVHLGALRKPSTGGSYFLVPSRLRRLSSLFLWPAPPRSPWGWLTPYKGM